MQSEVLSASHVARLVGKSSLRGSWRTTRGAEEPQRDRMDRTIQITTVPLEEPQRLMHSREEVLFLSDDYQCVGSEHTDTIVRDRRYRDGNSKYLLRHFLHGHGLKFREYGHLALLYHVLISNGSLDVLFPGPNVGTENPSAG